LLLLLLPSLLDLWWSFDDLSWDDEDEDRCLLELLEPEDDELLWWDVDDEDSELLLFDDDDEEESLVPDAGLTKSLADILEEELDSEDFDLLDPSCPPPPPLLLPD